MLYDVVWRRMMLYDVVWCCMMLYDVVWRRMTSYDVVWCCIMLYDVVLRHMTSYDVVFSSLMQRWSRVIFRVAGFLNLCSWFYREHLFACFRVSILTDFSPIRPQKIVNQAWVQSCSSIPTMAQGLLKFDSSIPLSNSESDRLRNVNVRYELIVYS